VSGPFFCVDTSEIDLNTRHNVGDPLGPPPVPNLNSARERELRRTTDGVVNGGGAGVHRTGRQGSGATRPRQHHQSQSAHYAASLATHHHPRSYVVTGEKEKEKDKDGEQTLSSPTRTRLDMSISALVPTVDVDSEREVEREREREREMKEREMEMEWEREQQRRRQEKEHEQRMNETFIVDAIFSAHSDGLMVILRRA